jgi:RNA polymerase sigma-54 factor
VLVNQSYFATVSGKMAKNTPGQEFLSECMQTANWLVRSLDQRARTITKVASEIVRQQDAFLLHGVDHLRPLNLKAVADAIGMHESTVSRVTSNKYMITPRGVFRAEILLHRLDRLGSRRAAMPIQPNRYVIASRRSD